MVAQAAARVAGGARADADGAAMRTRPSLTTPHPNTYPPPGHARLGSGALPRTTATIVKREALRQFGGTQIAFQGLLMEERAVFYEEARKTLKIKRERVVSKK